MNDEQPAPSNVIDTTDCLEAVETFRWWKNFLFILVLLFYLLIQVSFWLVDRGLVQTEKGIKSRLAQQFLEPEPVVGPQKQLPQPSQQQPVETKTAEQAAIVASTVLGTVPKGTPDGAYGEPNQPPKEKEQAGRQPGKKTFSFEITYKRLDGAVRFFNFILIPASMLYCLVMLFAMKVSLLGRLGGINHIAKAFFLSLVFFVFLVPWQIVYGGTTGGVMYTAAELMNRYEVVQRSGAAARIPYYGRYVVYWFVILMPLVLAQIRSARWSKAVLRRLEIMV